ncbi:hypothetical protein [Escherichia albertii]|uniref:hypothetical protein n=1 Tax=Escherichia albertii TaxID=208962 RepID=UPI001F14DB64|nr:hypothetical protein [Escherichia albertii]
MPGNSPHYGRWPQHDFTSLKKLHFYSKCYKYFILILVLLYIFLMKMSIKLRHIMLGSFMPF